METLRKWTAKGVNNRSNTQVFVEDAKLLALLVSKTSSVWRKQLSVCRSRIYKKIIFFFVRTFSLILDFTLLSQGRSRRAFLEHLMQRNIGGILTFLDTFIKPRSWIDPWCGIIMWWPGFTLSGPFKLPKKPFGPWFRLEFNAGILDLQTQCVCL